MTHLPQLILGLVASVLLVLALIDIARHRRVTLAAQVRLLTAAIFGLVLVWLFGGWGVL
jgi:hypothetical protein